MEASGEEKKIIYYTYINSTGGGDEGVDARRRSRRERGVKHFYQRNIFA